ncbi:hypothetical protein D6850_01715 [Roseovarius spongiae]|uniref:Mitochondrial inner membrane protein n=2 Tax=Roseovarius spongiae TaxID=2320272 RepID=A0A3A8AVK5_9RHOB|nr:hypothetical protein D6850_01715 [Roseovarius spongiae]
MVLGGVIAACLGGALVYFLLPQVFAPDTAWRDQVVDTQEAQAGRIDALDAKLAELPPPAEMPDLGRLETGQEELRATLEELTGQIATLQSRLGALESRPVAEGSGVSEGQITDLQAALDAQRAALAEQKQRIDTLISAADAREAKAESAATATLQQAALTRIRTALDTGAPFEDALADLAQTGADVPDDLRAAAADGVPTLATLQAEFPPAARVALRDARKERADAGEGETGVMAFIGEQLGARSLEPREGDDPDAVLSRAEAALREGRLADALAEIEALPPSGQAALQSWVDSARARMNATDAADALSAQLN